MTEQEEAIAVIKYYGTRHKVVVWKASSQGVVELARDGGTRRGAAQELSAWYVMEVEEDAAQREWKEVRTQQAVAINDAVPRLADTAGRGEAVRREATEDIRQHVIRQRRCHVHRSGTWASHRTMASSSTYNSPVVEELLQDEWQGKEALDLDDGDGDGAARSKVIIIFIVIVFFILQFEILILSSLSSGILVSDGGSGK